MTAGCVNNARSHVADVHASTEPEMTVGIVQKEIRRGQSQGEVAEKLGSPNIVSTDLDGSETWIYDKIATLASYSNSSGNFIGGAGAGGDPGSSLLLGLGLGAYSKNSGASATTQKTLTVVIKFGKDRRVNDFSYHSSKF